MPGTAGGPDHENALTVSYRVPPRVLRRLGLAMVGRRATSLRDDCAEYIGSVTPAPQLLGVENVPAEGPFCAVANHCERHGLWIGFPSALLVTAVARRRAGDPPLHFAVVDQTRLRSGRLAVPGTAWAYRQVARCYGMVPIPARESATRGRAVAMRSLARLALPPPRGRGEPICFFPEGEHGTSREMVPALPGTGSFLLLLARAGVPVLPVGFAEVGGRLVARIGEPFLPSAGVDGGQSAGAAPDRDRSARDHAMRRIAALIPPERRGPYGGGL